MQPLQPAAPGACGSAGVCVRVRVRVRVSVAGCVAGCVRSGARRLFLLLPLSFFSPFELRLSNVCRSLDSRSAKGF